MSKICPSCGQDHHKAIMCIGASGGRVAKHDPEVQRANANKRWDAWRKEHPDKVKPVKTVPDTLPEPESKKSWRW